MQPRDKGADAAYWDAALDENFEWLKRQRAKLVDPAAQGTAALARPAANYLEARFRRIIFGYSAGAPIDSLAEDFADAYGQLYPDYLAQYPPGHVAALQRPSYSHIKRLLSLGVLCRLRGAHAEALVGAYDRWDYTSPPGDGHRDRICEALATFLAPDKPRPAPATGVNFPKAYATLWEAIAPETPEPERPGLLKTFLQSWFKTMDAEMVAETEPFHPNNFSFVGHWCFEAGAAVVIASIDDRGLRRHKHYPKDFVDYAREGQAD